MDQSSKSKLYCWNECLLANFKPAPASIRTWGIDCDSEAARKELKTMLNTHRVIPIPCYDMHGYSISPWLYSNCLVGAMVELSFQLSHWASEEDGTMAFSNNFIADVIAIRVLTPPKPDKVMPREIKVFHKMDPMKAPCPPPRKKI